MSRTCGRILLVAALTSASVLSVACAMRQARVHEDFGIPSCPDDATGHLLSVAALQCWFTAPHGRWRTLNHQSHLEALVIEVEAQDVRDAVAIAERVVADPMATEYSEILVYVAQPRPDGSQIRRVQWTRGGRFETLDFSSPAGETPLTVRSSPGGGTVEPHPEP
jgi:hypothetical protein